MDKVFPSEYQVGISVKSTNIICPSFRDILKRGVLCAQPHSLTSNANKCPETMSILQEIKAEFGIYGILMGNKYEQFISASM